MSFEVAHLRPQAQALLEAFQKAGNLGMTTGELLRFTYEREDSTGKPFTAHIGDWRSRKSDLVKAGWMFEKTSVEGTSEYRYRLLGKHEILQLELIGAGAAA